MRSARKADGQIGLKHEDAFAGRLLEIERVDVAHGSGSCTPSADGLILDSKNGSSERAYVGLPPVLIANSWKRVCR
jgi:hypothetical protein